VTVKVVDASALAALAFQETKATEILNRIDGHELHAPALLWLEMANVCLKKIRAQPALRDLLIDQHKQSLAMRVQAYDVDPTEILILAERLSLSAYDASYLWLARMLRAELVTLDERLEKAVAKI
jgi:predicted nucleic acid-binding protein